jgi:N-methylhydantoinase A
VSLRVSAVGAVSKPALPRIEEGDGRPNARARIGARNVVFDVSKGPVEAPVYVRAALLAEDVLPGPAIVQEPGTTTVLRPGDRAAVGNDGSLLVEVGRADA